MRPPLPRARAATTAALCAAALATTLAACGSAPAPGSTAAAPTPQGAPAANAADARRGGDVITEEEIRASEFRDAYQIVERLRPQFLRSRGATNPYDRQGSTTAPIVYLNNQKMGAIESLRDVPAGSIREIRYFSARDAATRWGTGETAGGVIMVTTKGQ